MRLDVGRAAAVLMPTALGFASCSLLTYTRAVLTLTFTKRAAKSLRRLPANEAARIRVAIDRLAEEPEGSMHDVKTRHGASGLRRLRVGEWRVLFEMPAAGELLILDVLPRGSAYRRIGGDD